MIEAAGLAPFFSGGVTGEDGFPSKPAPDAILHLLNTHAIPPGQALMIGDRLIDVQAAQNAGIAGCWWTEKEASGSAAFPSWKNGCRRPRNFPRA